MFTNPVTNTFRCPIDHTCCRFSANDLVHEGIIFAFPKCTAAAVSVSIIVNVYVICTVTTTERSGIWQNASPILLRTMYFSLKTKRKIMSHSFSYSCWTNDNTNLYFETFKSISEIIIILYSYYTCSISNFLDSCFTRVLTRRFRFVTKQLYPFDMKLTHTLAHECPQNHWHSAKRTWPSCAAAVFSTLT
jgi:hypothetical protein